MTYLKKFGIGNFRVFKDLQEFDFAPITILTGKNNSGKSSVIKSILTMKNNNNDTEHINKKKHNIFKDLSFNARELHIGSVENIINYENSKGDIEITFSIYSNDLEQELIIRNKYQKYNEEVVINSVSIYSIDEIELMSASVDYKNGSTGFYYNHTYFIEKIDRLFNKISNIKKNDFRKFAIEEISNIDTFERIKLQQEIEKSILKIKKIDDNKIGDYGWVDVYDYCEEAFTFSIKTNNHVLDFDFEWNFHMDLTIWLENFIGKNIIENIIENNIFKKTYYLPPIRNNQERLHSKNETLSINAIIEEIKKKKLLDVERYVNFVEKQLKIFEIGDEIEIVYTKKIYYGIYVRRNNRKVLLSDLGLGFSQLVPIILQIIIIAYNNKAQTKKGSVYFNNSLFLLEEPEANLHPDFQSKLADMFVEAEKIFNIQFIIETHSEYLIRKLQYLTAKKVINTEDSVIYYFNNPNNIPKGEAQVKRITIDEYGGLSDTFGQGFYDESTRLQFDLLKLNKEQSN